MWSPGRAWKGQRLEWPTFVRWKELVVSTQIVAKAMTMVSVTIGLKTHSSRHCINPIPPRSPCKPVKLHGAIQS